MNHTIWYMEFDTLGMKDGNCYQNCNIMVIEGFLALYRHFMWLRRKNNVRLYLEELHTKSLETVVSTYDFIRNMIESRYFLKIYYDDSKLDILIVTIANKDYLYDSIYINKTGTPWQYIVDRFVQNWYFGFEVGIIRFLTIRDIVPLKFGNG